PGLLRCWITWDPEQFAVSIYRIKVSWASPESKIKEGCFSVTYDPPQKGPFVQDVELPTSFLDYIAEVPNRKALITYEMKAVENVALANTLWIGKFKKELDGASK